MNSRKKLFLIFLVFTLIFSALSITMVSSATSVYIRPKKAVYLVIDDSGSMGGKRENDANYALQTFLSVLDKDEQVVVYFLNDKKAIGDIDIANKSNELLENVRVKYPKNSGSTPFDVVREAADDLRKAAVADSDREYWLVVVTDGGFDTNPQNYMEKFTNTPLKNGDYPNFLYLGIDGGQSFSIPKGAEDRFFIDASTDIIAAMNDAVMQITNRYVINASNKGNQTITFDLPYPARNIVVLAQTFDTKIVSYESISNLNIDENYKIEYPVKNPSLQYSSVGYITEKSGSSIKSGTINLTYDKPIDTSKIIVMVEPAIGINAVYIGEGGHQIDPSEMQVGENITVEMTICDSETKEPLSSDTVLGKVNQYITVNGTKYDGNNVTFQVPEKDLDISLVAEFSDGFMLDISQKVTDLVAKRNVSLFVSDSGYFESDIKDLNTAKGIVVTPLINDSKLTAEDMSKATLTIDGGSFFTNRFEIIADETTGTYTIHPKAGFLKVFTPTDEVTFDICFYDGVEKTVNDTITVKITGRRPIPELILAIFFVLLVIYLIFVEITRERFPKGSYVKYYNVTREGAPDGNLTDRIYLNRPSLEKLKNGSYAPFLHTSYKVSGKYSCEGLTFVAFDKTSIKVNGVTDIVEIDDWGNEVEKTSFIPTNKSGEPLTVNAPTDDKTKTKFLLVPLGSYVRDAKITGTAKLSSNEHDKQTGEIEF